MANGITFRSGQPSLPRRPITKPLIHHDTAPRLRRRVARLLYFIIASVLVSGVAFIAFIAYFYITYSKIVDERLASGYLTSQAGIYAAPRVLRAGQNFPRGRLVESLRRAGYIETDASNVWSGAFTAEAESVEIRRGARAAAGITTTSPDTVRIDFDKDGRIAAITDSRGRGLLSYALEPEALTSDAALKTNALRPTLGYRDLPPVLVHAILSIEDRRFFEHHGLDLFGIVRATLSWLASGSSNPDGRERSEIQRQGGSTITQQLVKNTYLSPERTLRRKFNEAILASVLEHRLSKEDIFALYCNEIYLGQRGHVGVRGVAQAARVFFGKDLKDLSLAEAATIAGMIQSPSRYAPDRYPERAEARRNIVLAAMLRDRAITAEEAQAASLEPVRATPAADEDATAPYFIDYINRIIESRIAPGGDASERNLRIYTTIDLDLQQFAEEAVRHQLERLDWLYKSGAHPQAALVALDPHTGHILAMVGGRSYGESQLNRVTDARRQPGSVFKPFVYAAALENGISPVTMYTDAPHEFIYDRRATYRPANYGGAYSMRDVTMRTGLVRSLNVVTVDVAMRTGLEHVASLAEKFGLPRPEPYPSLALGTSEATPLEIAAAYTAFANNGRMVKPTAVTRVVNATGSGVIEESLPPAQQVIEPATSYMMTDMLSAVISEGTARAARGAVEGTAVAGKTGTSHDGWFAGYSPNLVCVVWVGFDDNNQLGLTGAESALPVWTEFMKEATGLRPELGGARFVSPEDVTTVEIDPATGMLASPACPQRERIAISNALALSLQPCAHGQTLIASTNVVPDPVTSLPIVSSDSNGLPATEIPVDPPRPSHPPHGILVGNPSNRATQVEMTEDGRMRLTNEMLVNTSRAGSKYR